MQIESEEVTSLFFLFGGKAEMLHAPYSAVCGTPLGLASGPICPLDSMPCVLPTKTLLCRWSGHIPLRKVDGKTYFKAKIRQASVRPQFTDFALSHFPPTAFHEKGRVPAFGY